MTKDRRRAGYYLATYDQGSPEYALARFIAFGALAVLFVGFGIALQPAVAVLGLLPVFAALVWWRRWQRALGEDLGGDE